MTIKRLKYFLSLSIVLVITGCSPKLCGDSSICQCHHKKHRNKVGNESTLAYQEGEKKNKRRWYKRGAGLKKARGKRSERQKF